MRFKLPLLAAVAALSISLGGCVAFDKGQGGACTGVTDLVSIAKCAQALAKESCGFLGALDDIAAAFAAGAFADQYAFAQAACRVVDNLPQSRRVGASGGVVITVNGRTIHGTMSARRG